MTGIALMLPVTLSVMGAVLLAPIMPQLSVQFGHVANADYWVPALLSVPALCIALVAPLVGMLADRIGRRRLLMAAMVIYSIFGVAPLLLDHFVAIMITRVVVGICEAVVMVCSTAMIGDLFSPQQRDRWLGNQAATASITAFVLFPVAGWLGDTLGWRGPFLIYASGLLFLPGVIWLTWESGGDEHQPDQQAMMAPHAHKVRAPLPWRHILTVCASTLVAGVMFYILQFQMANAMDGLGVASSTQTGLLLSLASLGVPAGAITFALVKKWGASRRGSSRRGLSRISVPTLLLLEFSLLALGFYGMARASQPGTFILPAFVNQFGAGLLLPTLLTWVMQPLSFEVRGRGTGIWQSTFAAAQFLSTLSFSFVMARVSSIQSAFLVFSTLAAGYVVVAGIILFIINARLARQNGR